MEKHPVALAFQEITTRTACTSSATTPNIESRILELAWRQKHSHSPLYPFSSNIKPQSHPITLNLSQQQCGEQDGTGTGAVVWNAAHVLAEFLCKSSRGGESVIQVSDRVCDIGCGTGLTGLVAAKLAGEGSVVFSDCGPVLELTRRNVDNNVRSNNITSKNTIAEYWWGSGTLGHAQFDVLLIADCILPKLYPVGPLVDAIAELMAATGVCFVSYEHRLWHEFDPRHKFRELCEGKGLKVDKVSEDRLDDVYRGDDIEVWCVRWAVK